MFRYLVAAALSLTAAQAASADDIRCNKKQSRCSIENIRFTIGDRIAVLNETNELVATGVVDGINGRKRKVAIKKRHGKIYAGYKLTRIDDSEIANIESTYKVYKKASDTTIGASADLASVAVGEGVFSYGAQGYYESKIKKYLYWTGRGLFLTGTGSIRNPYGNTYGDSEVSVMAFGAMGGLVYKTKRRGDFVFRTEADLGFAYVSADIDGDADLADENIEQLGNGFGLLGKVEVAAIYQGMDWSPALIGSYGVLQSARSTSVGIGISKALD